MVKIFKKCFNLNILIQTYTTLLIVTTALFNVEAILICWICLCILILNQIIENAQSNSNVFSKRTKVDWLETIRLKIDYENLYQVSTYYAVLIVKFVILDFLFNITFLYILNIIWSINLTIGRVTLTTLRNRFVREELSVCTKR